MILIERTIPKTCYDCPCTNDGFYRCLLEDKQLDDDCEQRRPTWCPLHEATADPDTVSRQAIRDAIRKLPIICANGSSPAFYKVDDINRVINDLPSSPSRPQGRWIRVPVANGLDKYRCDKCGHYVTSGEDKNFCPHCGADMRQNGGAV